MQGKNNERGQAVELAARRHLERRGLKMLASNFRTRWGEIDLVMNHDGQVVFVEVRYRADKRFGGAAASVTMAKQARILRAAAQFLEQHRLAHRPVRFDIVTAEGAGERLEWLVDAFRPSE